MSRKSYVLIIATAFALALLGLTLLSAQVTSESRENTARQEKNRRYDGGHCDLTRDEECIEQYEPRALPLIPLKESAFAFVGQVTKMQPWLSEDRTHIYTEASVHVGEVLKSPEGFSLPPDRMLITDQIGGAIKVPSGHILRDNTRSGFMGRPYVGGRYVLFVREIHEGKDLEVLRAYELRDGKVFKLAEDGGRGQVILSKTSGREDSFSREKSLLHFIHEQLHAPTATTHRP
jgi:hypothetical protein